MLHTEQNTKIKKQTGIWIVRSRAVISIFLKGSDFNGSDKFLDCKRCVDFPFCLVRTEIINIM